MTDALGTRIAVEIDDRMVRLIRGPMSCRNAALKYLSALRDQSATPDDELTDAIAWLEKMEF